MSTTTTEIEVVERFLGALERMDIDAAVALLEVREGRIVLWRDRFDFIDFAWSFMRGAVQALRSGRR